jgi:hypothetical protein
MAHFWSMDDSGRWLATQITRELALNDSLDVIEASVVCALPAEQALLRRLAHPPETWAVLCPPHSALRVNGELVPLGLTVLSDRDEISLPGQPVRFFSTETVAQVEPFPHDTASGCCPRCKLPIGAGSPAVRCPSCGLWHHSSAEDEMPCWGYAPTCAGCSQPTALDAGFRWTPEDL